MVIIGDYPHETVLKLLEIDDKEVSRLKLLPAIRSDLLDKLQVRHTVFHGRIEVKSLLPIKSISS